MCECTWSFKETVLKETSSMVLVHEKVADFWESRVELTDPAPENAGMYKCVVSNKFGEINANLSLNIEIAPVIRERPIIKKVEKKKSVVLQCAVQGSQELVAKSETGETQSQTVTLQEDQVKMEAAEASPESVSAATEESSVKKKKKKV